MDPVDFERVEEELGLVVPDIYRMFMEAARAQGLDLGKHGISHDTGTIVKGNEFLRARLEGQKPEWKNYYFDFGVGDGCGNYLFLIARDESDDEVKLWAHDPPGIEDIGPATVFLMELLAEVKADFKGPNASRFQGNGFDGR